VSNKKQSDPRDGEAESRLAQLVTSDAAPKVQQPSAEANDEQDYLCVRVGRRLFALSVADVLEVVPPSKITEVPHTPHYVPGIFDRHGRITAVLELSRFIGEDDEAEASRIVVLGAGELQAGVPVSEVLGIQAFGAQQLKPPLPSMLELGAFVQAHVLWAERPFIVIDAAQLLESARGRGAAAASP
jgi:chemotaxis signal transduction protein